MAKKETRIRRLYTPFETDSSYSWGEYPRPQLKRESYISLNGLWQLSVRKSDETTEKLGDITVPYPPESRLSGIERRIGPGETWLYTKYFNISEDLTGKKVLVHFGAVDTQCVIYVNDRIIGGHVGGYVPFTIDITNLAVTGENKIKLEVTDSLDTDFSYGKQSKKRGGMWYTPISGIWQSVWVEILPENHIEKLKIKPDLNSVTIITTGGRQEKEITIHYENGDKKYSYTGDEITIEVANHVNWTPENPYLYNFTLRSGEDKLESYFALRTVDIQKVKGQRYICLNGKPYFFHGLLDQGYYADGIYTPATPQGFVWDIINMKKQGFNTLRKHIKVEPDLFYYYCDKFGMIVFQDMMNRGEYHYIVDTVLPNLGIKKGTTHKPTEKRRRFFEKECRDIIDALYNHPCVCYYTIFNEGWGQYEADRIYTELKSVDPTRIWNASSGWFKEKLSDVDSEHIYFKPIIMKARRDRPLVLSEFGGYSYKVEGHSFNLDDNYGYKTFKDGNSLTQGIVQLYTKSVVPAIKKGLCRAVLTQVSDVEDETNGIATYDRQVIKTDPKVMQDMAEMLFETFKTTIK